uniref:Uncharacterized protein n=1 Tax=Amphimedon queenslandica TaxID=400682 RepID=A0A1X7UP08_AMPQE
MHTLLLTRGLGPHLIGGPGQNAPPAPLLAALHAIPVNCYSIPLQMTCQHSSKAHLKNI